jgi:hypothetical protein
MSKLDPNNEEDFLQGSPVTLVPGTRIRMSKLDPSNEEDFLQGSPVSLVQECPS